MIPPNNTQDLISDDTLIILGHVSGIFGILGWIKIFSETEPRENILQYCPWYLIGQGQSTDQGSNRIYKPETGKIHGKGLIAKIEGCNNRDLAATLVGSKIAIHRSQLPPLEPNEIYWSDLEGLQVQTTNGITLGKISYLFSTGANDVIVVQGERERLIPYVWDQVIRTIDLTNGLLIVDWDHRF